MVVTAWDLPLEQVLYNIMVEVEVVHKGRRHRPISQVPVLGVKEVAEMVHLRIMPAPLGLQIQVVEVVARRLVQPTVVMVVLE
jgi:hypothetical protein